MKKVLVPFDNLSRLDKSLASALNVADELSAEILLLRVNPRINSLTSYADLGSLYSELRALQVQIQNAPVPVKIQTMPGTIKEAITHFTDTLGDDIVVLPGLMSV